jgi:hypothetical protein
VSAADQVAQQAATAALLLGLLPALRSAARSQPCPDSASWNSSPDPPRSNDLRLCDFWMPVCNALDQPTTESVSMKTGECGVTGITTGWPSELIASRPVPVNTELNRPPPNMPAPRTI